MREVSWWLAVAAVCTVACSDERAPPPLQSAVLVSLDTARADAFGCYGGRASTPNLDGLARESLVFDEARSVAPLTLPAHASMLTGLTPLRHGVRDNGGWPLPASAETLAERARAAGVSTAAFVAAAVLDRSFGLSQGFEVYDQPERPLVQRDTHFIERRGEDVVASAAHWLQERERGAPFFLWVHLFDPHAPYEAPPAFDLPIHAGSAYLGEIAYVDAALGQLLDALRETGALDEALLIVVADHGESLGEHGETTHGSFVYDAALRVPLLLRDPGGAGAGQRSAAPVSVVDVAPTLARALGVELPPGIDGVDLASSRLEARTGVYFECYAGWLNNGWSPLAGWTDARVKYVHSSAPELYDLRGDPGEKDNRLLELESDARRARAAIERLASLPRLVLEQAAGPDSGLLADLAALGYAATGPLAGELPEPLEPPNLPSPRERIGELNRVLEASRLAETGQAQRAVELLRPVLEQNPRNIQALDIQGTALCMLKQWPDALRVLSQRVELNPRSAQAWVNLADAVAHMGNLAGAEEALETALGYDPEHPAARRMLEMLRAQRGG